MFLKIFKTFGVRLSSAIISLLIAVVISQYLGAEGKGEQGIIITTIALILIFANIIGGASLVYLTPKLPLGKLLIPSYVWSFIVCGLFTLILFLFPLIEQKYIFHVALLTVINSLASVNSSVLLGKENIKAVNILNFTQVALTILALIVFFVSGISVDIYGYIYSLYIAYGLTFVFSLIFLLPYIENQKSDKSITYREAIGMLFRYGFMNQLAHITQLLSFRVSYYFLESYQGYDSVGIYSNGVSITESVWMISSSVALVQYSKISNTSDKKFNQDLSAELLRISLLVSFFVLIPLVLLPGSVYSFIFGKDFGDINRIMWLLAPGVLVFVNALILGHYFSGTGKYYVNSIGSAIGLLITIIMSVILIPAYGYLGAAFTATISYLATTVFVTWFFCRESKIKFVELLPLPRYFSGYYLSLKQYLCKNKAPRNE
ncbi:MAG TPA: polysaccharide biosynthesis C-terminal domain-containing protein [Bacteroidales bacterium]|nr:polysaccharide biosynthesis C-terminal domain-containing protein [Bacteroidales bacterium]